MNTSRKIEIGLLLVLLTALPWAHGALAGEIGSDPWNEIGAEGDSASTKFVPGTKVQIQAGMMYRFAGKRFDESSEPFLITLDLNVPFKWDRKGSTWGAGLHLAFDGDGEPP